MQKHQNIEKIIFKVVQIKFLAMHITIQKLININKKIYIFMVGHLQNIFMEHNLDDFDENDFWHKIKIFLTHSMYCWLLLQIYRCSL